MMSKDDLAENPFDRQYTLMGTELVVDPELQMSLKEVDAFRAGEITKVHGKSAAQHIGEANRRLLTALVSSTPQGGPHPWSRELELFNKQMVKSAPDRVCRVACSRAERMLVKAYCKHRRISLYAFCGFALLKYQEQLKDELISKSRTF